MLAHVLGQRRRVGPRLGFTTFVVPRARFFLEQADVDGREQQLRRVRVVVAPLTGLHVVQSFRRLRVLLEIPPVDLRLEPHPVEDVLLPEHVGVPNSRDHIQTPLEEGIA